MTGLSGLSSAQLIVHSVWTRVGPVGLRRSPRVSRCHRGCQSCREASRERGCPSCSVCLWSWAGNSGSSVFCARVQPLSHTLVPGASLSGFTALCFLPIVQLLHPTLCGDPPQPPAGYFYSLLHCVGAPSHAHPFVTHRSSWLPLPHGPGWPLLAAGVTCHSHNLPQSPACASKLPPSLQPFPGVHSALEIVAAILGFLRVLYPFNS